MAQAARGEICSIFLYADETFLVERMSQESSLEEKNAEHCLIIKKFIKRSLSDNREMLEAARTHGLRCIGVEDQNALDVLVDELAISLGRAEH